MKPLTATLDSFEDNQAVLVFADGQRLLVPKEQLVGFSEGDIVSLSFMNDIESREYREKVLKGILNEVISHPETDNQDS